MKCFFAGLFLMALAWELSGQSRQTVYDKVLRLQPMEAVDNTASLVWQMHSTGDLRRTNTFTSDITMEYPGSFVFNKDGVLSGQIEGTAPDVISATGGWEFSTNVSVFGELRINGVNGIYPFSRPTRLIFDGNSRTTGTNASDFPWPYWFTNLWANQNIAVATSVAVSGHTISNRLVAFPTDVAPFKPSGGTNAVLFLCDAIVDIVQNNTNLNTRTALLDYFKHAKSNGFFLVVCTMGDAVSIAAGGNNWMTNQHQWSNYRDINDFIRTNGLPDIVVDLERKIRADAGNTPDGLHWYTNANRMVAEAFYQAFLFPDRQPSSHLSGSHLVISGNGHRDGPGVRGLAHMLSVLGPFPGILMDNGDTAAAFIPFSDELALFVRDSPGAITGNQIAGFDQGRSWFTGPFGIGTNAPGAALHVPARFIQNQSTLTYTGSGAAGTNVLVNCALGNWFKLTATNNFHLLFTNIVEGYSAVINVRQDATGSRLGTFNNVNVNTNEIIVFTTTASALDILTVVSDDVGTNINVIAQKNFKH